MVRKEGWQGGNGPTVRKAGRGKARKWERGYKGEQATKWQRRQVSFSWATPGQMQLRGGVHAAGNQPWVGLSGSFRVLRPEHTIFHRPRTAALPKTSHSLFFPEKHSITTLHLKGGGGRPLWNSREILATNVKKKANFFFRRL